jgi:arylsulfatase A-like enzyme
VYAEPTYGIPPEQVVGTASGTTYGYAKNGTPFLTKEPKLLLNDDNAGKPEGIHLMIGVMGYKTPNIDRLAKEGALFTDLYAQQSCTAGRASFILGQQPFRTGLLTIGMPGSLQGIPDGCSMWCSC